MEEFHVYQWIFVFDYFGLKFETSLEKNQKITDFNF